MLTIPTTLAFILIISLILIFYGVRAARKVKNDNWIYVLFKILGMLLLVLVLAVVVVVIVLLFIACAIATDGAVDFGGLGGGGGRRKKKQK